MALVWCVKLSWVWFSSAILTINILQKLGCEAGIKQLCLKGDAQYFDFRSDFLIFFFLKKDKCLFPTKYF